MTLYGKNHIISYDLATKIPAILSLSLREMLHTTCILDTVIAIVKQETVDFI